MDSLVTVSAIVVANGSSRELVRTADSLRPQRSVQDLLIAAPHSASSPLLASLQMRLGAELVRGDTLAGAVNAAAQSARGGYLMIVPAGYRPGPGCLDACVWRLTCPPSVAAVAPSARLQLPDGTQRPSAAAFELSAAGILAAPAATPPVLCVSRAAWEKLNGLDEATGVLSRVDLAVRLLLNGGIAADRGSWVVRDAGAASSWPPDGVSDEEYLAAYRVLLEKHRSVLETIMTEVIVRQETGFGRLRDRHRALVARRDADLSALDAMRHETAHLNAWLTHHKRGELDWGDLRRTHPVSRDWGYDRGAPVDRYYIEQFLAGRSSDVRGCVLEVQEDDFTRAFGGPRVTRADVVDIDEANGRATVHADLRCAPHVPSDHYDTVILTQTLHVIDDMQAVLQEVQRILKPSGTLLATLPSASRVCVEYGDRGDFWRLTPDGARVLFESVFEPGAVETVAYGNVLTNVAFLEGLARQEIAPEEFDACDPAFPALVGVRAVKGRRGRLAQARAVLLYHRVDARSDVHGLSIAPQAFEAHLAFLQRTCHVLPLEVLLGSPACDLPPRAVAITLDDGYLDNLQVAAPLLERFGLPATYFVTSRPLEEPGEYWWDALARVLPGRTDLPRVLELRTPAGALTFATDSEQNRREAHARLHATLVGATLDEREQLVESLRRLGGPAGDHVRPMNADELRTLARVPGAVIGAHSVNHLSLAHQPSDVVRREMADCRAALERVLGGPVQEFAYPYGALADECVRLARREWRWACACDEQAVPESFDAARVTRIDAGRLDERALAARLDALFDGASERT